MEGLPAASRGRHLCTCTYHVLLHTYVHIHLLRQHEDGDGGWQAAFQEQVCQVQQQTRGCQDSPNGPQPSLSPPTPSFPTHLPEPEPFIYLKSALPSGVRVASTPWHRPQHPPHQMRRHLSRPIPEKPRTCSRTLSPSSPL